MSEPLECEVYRYYDKALYEYTYLYLLPFKYTSADM